MGLIDDSAKMCDLAAKLGRGEVTAMGLVGEALGDKSEAEQAADLERELAAEVPPSRALHVVAPAAAARCEPPPSTTTPAQTPTAKREREPR